MSLSLTAGLRCFSRRPLSLRLLPFGLPANPVLWRPLSTIPAAFPRSRKSILSQLRPGLFPSHHVPLYRPSRRSLATTPDEPPPSKPQLSEDILTVPNLLTILRLALTPYIGYLVCTAQFAPAVTLLFIAAMTDLLDGWIARRTGRFTVFGSIADPAADKALVTTMVVSLAVSGMMPWVLAAIILGRDAALVVSAFIIRYRTLAEPKTFKRYWNPSLPSATVTPTTISKYNTFFQLLLVGILTLYPIIYTSSPPPKMLPTSGPFEPPVLPDSSSFKRKTTDSRPITEGEGTDVLPDRDAIGYVTMLKHTIDLTVVGLMWLTAFTTIISGVGYLGGAGATKTLKSGGLLSQKVAQLRRTANSSNATPPTKSDSRPPSQ